METTKPTLTGVKKRQQIQNANRMVFIWVTGAAVVVAIVLVLAQAVYKQFVFNNDIIGREMKANGTLADNIKKYDGLKQEVAKLLADESLNKLRTDGADSPLQVVIDALPTTSDDVALLASLQQVLLPRSGVKIDSLSIQTADIAVQTAGTTTPLPPGVKEVPIALKVSGSYDAIKKMFDDLHHSIRPINITTVKITGAGNNLAADISALTYYSEPVNVNKKTETVKPKS